MVELYLRISLVTSPLCGIHVQVHIYMYQIAEKVQGSTFLQIHVAALENFDLQNSLHILLSTCTY